MNKEERITMNDLKEDITKQSVQVLMLELANLEKQIDLLSLKYEKIRLELIRRYQILEDTEEFKPKQKTIH